MFLKEVLVKFTNSDIESIKENFLKFQKTDIFITDKPGKTRYLKELFKGTKIKLKTVKNTFCLLETKKLEPEKVNWILQFASLLPENIYFDKDIRKVKNLLKIDMIDVKKIDFYNQPEFFLKQLLNSSNYKNFYLSELPPPKISKD